MTRIISGRFGGRRLSTPSGKETRPTSDRVREALFNTLSARTCLEGARFFDLYAGSGAIGLEALSRGASHVAFVESNPRAVRVIADNIAKIDARSQTEVFTAKVERIVGHPSGEPWDIVFADPPYAIDDTDIHSMLSDLLNSGWLAQDAMVVIERSARRPPWVWVPGITSDAVRRYGETALWYGRYS